MEKILRWIAVPFAAIASMWVAHALITLFCGLNTSIFETHYGVETTSITKIILALTRDGIAGYAMVYFGSKVAPSNNRAVSIVLATIQCIIVFVGICCLFTTEEFRYLSLLGLLATAFGSIKAVNDVEEKESV